MVSIVHVLSTLSLGGAERFVVELCLSQREDAVAAEILSLGSKDDFLKASAESAGIPVSVHGSSLSRFGRYSQTLKHLKKFDVVHIHSRGALVYVSVLLPFLWGKRVVLTRHGLEPMGSLRMRLLYKILRVSIDYVTFVTEPGLEVFKAIHQWPSNRLVVIRNGVPIPRLSREVHQAREKLCIASVGRMVALKGQRFLLEAFEVLSKQSAEKGEGLLPLELKFYGSGPLEDELKEQAKKIGSNDIHFMGQVADVNQLYAEVDVLVVTSETEGLSMVIIEAMARGIPVVATDVGGNPTLVHNLKTGLLIPYGSVPDLVSSIQSLIKDRSLVKQLGDSAQKLIAEEFSISKTHRQYLKCYIQ